MSLAPLLLAAALSSNAPDDALREALDRLYDGGTDTALARLGELSAAAPEDPLPVYLGALALAWKIEQRPDSSELDKELHRRAERAIALAEARLARDGRDPRALLARGAANGVRSRLHLFRLQKREAARAAVRMREDLLRLRELEPEDREVRFGLGLYDYYADVLPRLTKLLRLLAGMPGGNRERGLASIEQGSQAFLHGVEARWQLYEIYAFYEAQPDRAHDLIAGLRRRYPGSPLWALKLAEHQRDRMGLYAESAAVAREMLAAVEHGHPHYAPVVDALARLSLGESLLQDLRLAEARRVLLPVKDAAPGAAALGPRVHLLLGRSLELEGDPDGARAHYRLAAAGADREVKRAARAALEKPLPERAARALQAVAEGRRLRQAGRWPESAEAYRRALSTWPANSEATLRVAEDDLARGRVELARAPLEKLIEERAPEPPWLRPWAWLLLGRTRDLEGNRAEALEAYRRAWGAPLGQLALRQAAAAGLEAPYSPERPDPDLYNSK